MRKAGQLGQAGIPAMMRPIFRIVLAIAYFAAGVIHIIAPRPFLSIMPGWVPLPEAVVFWTGIAEIAGAAGLLQSRFPSLRRAAAIGLALYAVCVFPANINHFMLDMARPDNGAGFGYHVPRMFIQPLLVWLALWVGHVTDWPLRAQGN